MDARDIAYGVVKKLKAAYSQEGCDWQVEIERAIREAVEAAIEMCAVIAEDPCLRPSSGAREPNDVTQRRIAACIRARSKVQP